MKDRQRKGLLPAILEAVFVGVPTLMGRNLFHQIQRISNRSVRMSLFAGMGLVSAGLLLSLKWLGQLLSSARDLKLNGIPVYFLVSYGCYLVITLPFFVLLAYVGKEAEKKLLGQGGKRDKRDISASNIRIGRSKAGKDKAYLGSSFRTGNPFYLTDAMRLMHTHVVGSTGVGKTESVLLPLLRHDVAMGKGAIVIDAKGDLELFAKIRQCVETSGRGDDFLFFSLSHPEISRTYNPLLRGNASEIKDKLIGSTEWREEFYRKKAEEAALTLLRPMVELGRKVKFRDLYYLLTDSGNLRTFKDQLEAGNMYHDLQVMENHFGDNLKFLSGLISDLALVTKSEFSRLVDVDKSEIDLLKVYEDNKIVYFSLNTQGYEETAKRFGRLILQDIKTVSNEIQTQKAESERHFFPVFVDEFSSFVYENFIEFLNKGRGAGFAITLLHQSLADLATKRITFQQQILENTNIKIIMRQDDPFSVEKFAKIGGARKTLVSTYQTEERMLGTGFTGVGSMREGQTFRIDPDLVRSLGRGEAIVIAKAPRFQIDYLKLDYDRDMPVLPMMEKIKQEKRQALEYLKREKEKASGETQKGGGAFKTLKNTEERFRKQKGTAVEQ